MSDETLFSQRDVKGKCLMWTNWNSFKSEDSEHVHNILHPPPWVLAGKWGNTPC